MWLHDRVDGEEQHLICFKATTHSAFPTAQDASRRCETASPQSLLERWVAFRLKLLRTALQGSG